MLAEKLKLENDQNAQLRHQVAQLLQLEQDQELQMQQQNSTIETLQVSCALIINHPSQNDNVCPIIYCSDFFCFISATFVFHLIGLNRLSLYNVVIPFSY